MNEQILDQAEVSSLGSRTYHLWTHRLNTIDYLVNIVLIGLVVIGGIMGMIDKLSLLLALVAFLALGTYQLLSGLIGAIRGNRDKLVYLLSALGFLVISILIAYLIDYQGSNDTLTVTLFFIGIAISFGGACYYTVLCHRAKERTAL